MHPAVGCALLSTLHNILLTTLPFDYCFTDCYLFNFVPLYYHSPTHSHWGHCPGHKCLNCEGNMAMD